MCTRRISISITSIDIAFLPMACLKLKQNLNMFLLSRPGILYFLNYASNFQISGMAFKDSRVKLISDILSGIKVLSAISQSDWEYVAIDILITYLSRC